MYICILTPIHYKEDDIHDTSKEADIHENEEEKYERGCMNSCEWLRNALLDDMKQFTVVKCGFPRLQYHSPPPHSPHTVR